MKRKIAPVPVKAKGPAAHSANAVPTFQAREAVRKNRSEAPTRRTEDGSSATTSSEPSRSVSPHFTTAASAPRSHHLGDLAAPPRKATPNSTTAAALKPPAREPRKTWWIAAVPLCVALIALLVMNVPVRGGRSSAAGHHPCACAAATASTNPLARALLSRRGGVSGVHWRHMEKGTDWLAFAAACSGMSVVPLPSTFSSVEQLRDALHKPLASGSHRCVLWVTSPTAVDKVANALKELMENNALAGQTVVPPQSRAVLVMESPQSREQLKEVLPHRVVHMLTDVN